MTKRELVETIAKVVRLEVRKAVKQELRAVLTENSTPHKVNPPVKPKPKPKQGKPKSLTEALEMTRADQEWETAGQYTSADSMRSQFRAMQQPQSPIPTRDVNGAPLDPSRITPDVMNALTRDYSSLMKHPKMKGTK